MIALVTANLTNVFFNWVFIYGHLGFPSMGVRGSAWATVISRVVMAGYLLVVIIQREHGRRPGCSRHRCAIEWTWMRRLLALGVPAASQITLEVGVFAASTALAGRLAPIALAAHQIAINIAALSFMVPLGIGSAGAVRVGHAVGRRDPSRRRARGMDRADVRRRIHGVHCSDVRARAEVLMGAFTRDEGVLQLGASLLAVAAVFQLFDGIQGVATGVLRGLGDTRTPDGLEPRRPLVRRTAERLLVCALAGQRRDRLVVGIVDRPHHLRCRAARRLVAADSRVRVEAT